MAPSSTIATATRIQSCVRRFLAKQRVARIAGVTWERIFDPPTQLYFWFNRRTGVSQWTLPHGIRAFYSDQDLAAALLFQRIVRGFLARRLVKRVAAQCYRRYYDAEQMAFYWLDSRTGVTTWEASPWLVNQQIPLSAEDEALLNAHRKIRELQEALERKDQELHQVREQRYEELEPKALQERAAAAKAVKRSKHMDEWTTDQLAAWFTEMKMTEYIPLLYKNR